MKFVKDRSENVWDEVHWVHFDLSSLPASLPPLAEFASAVSWFFAASAPLPSRVTGSLSLSLHTLGHLQTELAHAWPHFTAVSFPLGLDCIRVCVDFLSSIKALGSIKSVWAWAASTYCDHIKNLWYDEGRSTVAMPKSVMQHSFSFLGFKGRLLMLCIGLKSFPL